MIMNVRNIVDHLPQSPAHGLTGVYSIAMKCMMHKFPEVMIIYYTSYELWTYLQLYNVYIFSINNNIAKQPVNGREDIPSTHYRLCIDSVKQVESENRRRYMSSFLKLSSSESYPPVLLFLIQTYMCVTRQQLEEWRKQKKKQEGRSESDR